MTRADAAATEVVQLATHRVTAAHRPYVEVVVNGATIATVGFELGLALDVDAVVGHGPPRPARGRPRWTDHRDGGPDRGRAGDPVARPSPSTRP